MRLCVYTSNIAIIAATLWAPTTGLAQTVDIGLHAAFYNPFGSVTGPPIEKRPLASVGGGVDAIVWTSRRLGFAGRVMYAPSRVAVIQPGNVVDREASVILANARVLFAVTPLAVAGAPVPPWSVYVGAGAGLVSRSGGIWMYASGLTSPALVWTVGVQTPGGARYTLRFDMEDYISRAQFNGGMPDATVARVHHDLAFSLSVTYRVRSR
jgi:hypothetical protein